MLAVAESRKCSVLEPKNSTAIPDYDDSASACDNVDTTATFGKDARQVLLDWHNQYRASLANGCSKLPDGSKAPKAKNMKKMIYNCSLEAIAQKYASTCPGLVHSQREGLGENIYFGYSSDPKQKSNFFAEAADNWWNELKKDGLIGAKDLTFDMSKMKVAHFTQMSWAETTSVGCGFARCPSGISNVLYGALVVCNYYPRGNMFDQSVYQSGKPCNNDKSCGGGTCEKSTGLCVV